MSLEFNATVRDKGLGNDDKKKILLEIPISELKGKVEELTQLTNKTVTIQLIPQYYSYKIPFDRSTNKPTQEYVVNNDGTIDFVKKEQTQLELDEKGNIDVEDRDYTVTKEVIDEFIMKAKSLEFPGLINPRDALIRTENGESFEDLAEDYEMSEITVINELEKAREYYAPYAAAWDKKRNEVIFEEITSESDETEPISEETEQIKVNSSEESENVSETILESENETEENSDDDDENGEVDPY